MKGTPWVTLIGNSPRVRGYEEVCNKAVPGCPLRHKARSGGVAGVKVADFTIMDPIGISPSTAKQSESRFKSEGKAGMGTTVERGYGQEHRRQRAQLAPMVESGQATCVRCGGWIAPGTPWDLGHDDRDRSVWTGPEHRKCNRATAGRWPKRRVQSAPTRIQSQVW
jgi:hypothetical protein